MAEIIDGVDINSCDDESILEQLLDELELDRIEDRRRVRSKLQCIKAAQRAARDSRMERLANSREEGIQKRQKEANEHKQRTLEMYDKMAKSAPAGGPKIMNVNILRGIDDNSVDSDYLSSSSMDPPRRDLVEEAIRDRHRASEEEKNRILAAYDAAAKSGPAGTYRVADLKNFKKEDAKNFTPQKPVYSCTFGSSGGIPVITKASSPARSASPASPSSQTSPLVLGIGDAQERMIRERQRQMEENKKRILAAYDAAAKAGPGPKNVIIPELPPDCGSTRRSLSTFGSFPMQVTKKPTIIQNASDAKERILRWANARTANYQISIVNFSSSWSNGLAFCAIIHSYFPDAFDFFALHPQERRKNFELAFKVAEDRAGIAPLLDVKDMVLLKDKPDWKCVFTYVQEMYRSLIKLQ